MIESHERRRRSRTPALLGMILGGMLLLMIAGAFAIRSFLSPERLRTQVIQLTAAKYGSEPDLESVGLTYLPLGIRLQGFSLPGVEPGDPPLFTFESAHARIQPFPLLARTLIVHELQLVKPRVHLRRVGGQLLLPENLREESARRAETAITTATRAQGGGQIRRIAITGYEIQDGALTIAAEEGADEVRLEGVTLEGDLDLREGGKTIASNGKVALAGLSMAALSKYEETLKKLKPSLEYRVAYDSEAGAVHIEEAVLVADPLQMKGRGEITGIPKAPVLSFTIDPREYELAEILPLVPRAIIPEGREPTGSGKVELGGSIVSHLADSTAAQQVDGRLKLEGVAFGIEGFPASLSKVNGEVLVKPLMMEFVDLNGTLAGEPFLIDGTLENLEPKENARYDLKIKLRAELDELARLGFAPPGGSLTGLIDADVTARGAGTDPAGAAVNGTVLAQNVTARLPDMRLPIQNIQARAAFRGNVAIVEQFSGSIGRTSFSATGEVRNPFTTQEIILSGNAAIVDLNELFPSSAPPPAKTAAFFPFAGVAHADSPLPPLVPAIPDKDMTLDFTVDSLLTGENVFTGAKLHATTHGKVANVRGTFTRARMGTVMLENLAGNGEIRNGRLEGTFTSASAAVPRIPLTDVKGNIRVNENRVMHLGDVTAKLWAGAVRANLELDFRDPGAPGFRVESNANDVRANDLLSSITPAKDILVGTLDLTSAISGKGNVPEAIARSLTGEGSMSAKGGKLQLSPAIQGIWSALGMQEKNAIDFKEFFAPFRIEQGKFVTRDLKLSGGDADWAANGAVGFDGMLDYQVEVTLNEELSNLYRKRIGRDLAKLLAGTTGRLTLDLRVTGNARSPKVQVDTKRLAERAAGNVTATIEEEVEKKVLDKLGDLLGGKPRADSVSADSTVAKSDSTAARPTQPADSVKANVRDILDGIFKRK